MRRSLRFGLLALVPAVMAGLVVRQNLIKKPHAVPASTTFRRYLSNPNARMVAYAPGDAVLADPKGPLARAQLSKLRERFDGLALYGCTPEVPALVELARSLGYKAVLLTVWEPGSESELATASSIVRDQASKMAVAVSIGSEGLLEKRYTLDDMQAARRELLDRNAAPTSVEMTTTEPWWLYLKPESEKLRAFGEFTSVNVHVVWDSDIDDPALAAEWTRDRANEVQRAVAKPLLIREAGLPGSGSTPRQGRTLVFTRTMQAAFWQSWFTLPDRPPLVAFEGIDNPGKHWRDFEGSWGLLSPELQPWPAWEVFPVLPGQ